MGGSDPAGNKLFSGISSGTSQLVRKYLGPAECSLPSEVGLLVAELDVHQGELEAQNERLRETQRQLEAYRDRYVNLYDFAPVGYVTLDADGYVQEINRTGADLLGEDRDALTGYLFVRHVARQDAAAFLDHLQTCVGQHRAATTELTLIVKGGSAIAVQLHSMPIEGLDDTLCKTAITDITERKRAEEALARERNLLRTLLDHLPDCVYVKDMEGRFVAANLAVARLMGANSPQELLGRTDRDFYPEAPAAEYTADEKQLLRSGEPLLNKDEPHRDTQGNARAVLTSKVPLKDSRGMVIGLVGISRDITERKAAEEAVLRLNEELQQANADLEAFTSSVCHDLRGPLSIIGGLNWILSRQYADKLDEGGKECLARISAEAQHMSAIIEALMKLSRVTRTELQSASVDLSSLASAVAESLRSSGPQRQVQFVIQEGVVAEGDDNLLRLVLENLMGNAWKFTSKHDRARIEFGSFEQGGQPVYFVRDDGVGFDMTAGKRVFGVFQRLHSGDEYEGSGVGLATVERIVRAHGGKVWTEAAVEQGATFFFTLS